MPDWGSPGIWICSVAIVLLSLSWGALERRVKLLARGWHIPKLGWKRSNLYIRIAQGLVTLALFAVVGASFWLFGWRIGLGAFVVSFAIAGATS